VIATALAATASDGGRIGRTTRTAPGAEPAAMSGVASGMPSPAVYPSVHPAVHPAADPVLGDLWSASRNLIVPVAGVTPDELVDTFAQIRGTGRRHEAIDIPGPRGTPVLAVTDGEILRLTEHDSGGITLYQLAPDRRTMFY